MSNMLKNNGNLDISKLITGKNKKADTDKMKKVIKAVDFIMRENEVSVAMAIAVFTGLKNRYDNFAINTTVLKNEDETDDKSKEQSEGEGLKP